MKALLPSRRVQAFQAFPSNPSGYAISLRGGRPAWSTAVGLGPIPYRFAGSNPAPRTPFLQ